MHENLRQVCNYVHFFKNKKVNNGVSIKYSYSLIKKREKSSLTT